MHRLFLTSIAACLLFFPGAAATLRLDLPQIEARFLAGNLELLAEKENIAMADAAVMQARAWENPTLSVGDLSFWSSRSQREGEKEVIPPLVGSFGRNTQFSLELSQLIETAGKRRKRIALERTGLEIAELEFEELLRSLRTELRQTVYEAAYLQESERIVAAQAGLLARLVGIYARQVEEGNYPASELLRLQAALFETESELTEIRIGLNAMQKTAQGLPGAAAGDRTGDRRQLDTPSCHR